MRLRRRTNLMWGVVLFAVSLTLLLHALGQIPVGIYDIINRAWPALLVLAGLSIVLRGRVPLGSGVAVLVSAGIVAGVAALAFSSRAGQLRDDYHFDNDQAIGADVSLLQINVQILDSDVEFRSGSDQTIHASFAGSAESTVTVDYQDSGDTRATYTLQEVRSREFPLLADVGRGRLVVELPPDLAMDVAFRGQDGVAAFNMGELSLERLNLMLETGDALVTLPAYNPLSPNARDEPGNLSVNNGNITIFVPSQVAAHLELNRGGSGLLPEYDPNLYNLLVGDVLEARNYDTASIKLRYVVTAPHGLIKLVVSGE